MALEIARHRLSCTTATFGGRLNEKLEAMRSAGFSATEFWPRDLYEHAEGPTIAIDLLRDNGLAVSAYQALRNYEGMPSAQRALTLEIARHMMDQMSLIDATTLVLCSNTSPQSSGDLQRLVDDLGELGDLARTRGMRVAYEVLCWGRWMKDYREGAKLVAAVGHDSIGLLLDSFHICALRLPLDGIDAIPPEKIFLVEFCDIADTRLDLIELARAYRLFPGEGVSPVREFLERVQAIGYSGHYSIEIFNAFYAAQPASVVARRAMSSLKSIGVAVSGDPKPEVQTT